MLQIRSLERYALLMNEAMALLLEKLDAAAQRGEFFNVHAAFKDMTMQVVGTTAFGCAHCHGRMSLEPACLCKCKVAECEIPAAAPKTGGQAGWTLRSVRWAASRRTWRR